MLRCKRVKRKAPCGLIRSSRIPQGALGEPWLALLLLLGLLGNLHVDDDSLDREGLVGDMDNLAA